jgi:hypothetical protein
MMRVSTSRVASAVTLAAALSFFTALPVFAADTGTTAAKEKPAHKTAMTKEAMSNFLVISPHTAEECLNVMDAVSAGGAEALAGWEWGCMAGDHTAYKFVHAKSEAEALKSVPESVRDKAKAIKVTKMTPAMLKSAHEQHKS